MPPKGSSTQLKARSSSTIPSKRSSQGSTSASKPTKQVRLGFQTLSSGGVSSVHRPISSFVNSFVGTVSGGSAAQGLPRQSDKAIEHSSSSTGVAEEELLQDVEIISKERSSGVELGSSATLWSDSFAPKNRDSLAVHKKKVTDVESWLKDALDGRPAIRKYRRLLTLTGPCGTGKTAVVKTLAAKEELDFEILEWDESGGASTSGGGNQGTPASIDRFAEFLLRGTAFSPLALDAGGQQLLDSYGSSVTDRNRRIILIDALPNTTHHPTLLAFQDVLSQYITTAADLPVPVILILSESRPRSDDDAWMTGGGSGGGGLDWRARQRDTIESWNLLPESVRSHPAFSEIRFNPVAPTILKKALKGILDHQFPRENANKRSKAGYSSDSKKLSRPPDEIVDAMIAGSEGDIRSAVNNLQFACGIDYETIEALGGSLKSNGKGKKSVRPDAAKVQALIEMLPGRSTSLALFHALGRVLYNKREGDEENDAVSRSESFQDLTEESYNTFSRRTFNQIFEDDKLASEVSCANWPPLPSHYAHRARRASKVNVDKLWGALPLDPSTFQLYLHQNYPSFSGEVENASQIAEWLSVADANMRPSIEAWQYETLSSYYSFLVSTSGALLDLPSPVPRDKQKLLKPTFWDAVKRGRDYQNDTDDGVSTILAVGDDASSNGTPNTLQRMALSNKSVLATEVIPLFSKIVTASREGSDMSRATKKLATLGRFGPDPYRKGEYKLELMGKPLDEHEGGEMASSEPLESEQQVPAHGQLLEESPLEGDFLHNEDDKNVPTSESSKRKSYPVWQLPVGPVAVTQRTDSAPRSRFATKEESESEGEHLMITDDEIED